MLIKIADVAAVSAGNNYEVGQMIAEALSKVGRKGVVTLEEGKSAENSLYVVEGMQFDRGHLFPYVVTDSEKMAVEFENCKLLLVDKKITNARDLINVLEEASKGGYSSLIMDEDTEQETLGTRGVNKMRGALEVAALKTPDFGERKSQYLDDIASSVAQTFLMSDCVVEIIAFTGRNEQPRRTPGRTSSLLLRNSKISTLGTRLLRRMGVLLWAKLMMTQIKGLGPSPRIGVG
ncbi:ruBisCO large subunit-binding protein subunit beta, chloroplastic [Dorcoceras hygrometricum]|uniref:RuBisCO large subunit-binding protein subunit beta, chloroplastic n=1 Tax=Dorcoceras hygrometricum TaxID=472368 RepID=A0A2Z7APT0_9LAMI|nr:ruBisCO large subunit-binding protein subunit beta, chloroplastic [Dorcoceras hygrometricum]